MEESWEVRWIGEGAPRARESPALTGATPPRVAGVTKQVPGAKNVGAPSGTFPPKWVQRDGGDRRESCQISPRSAWVVPTLLPTCGVATPGDPSQKSITTQSIPYLRHVLCFLLLTAACREGMVCPWPRLPRNRRRPLGDHVDARRPLATRLEYWRGDDLCCPRVQCDQ